ncbi:alpha/beta fold hydrolase [Nocardioides sp. Root140]|uniref:alpha/beta fold hydrolase n=1 Tax=Nocardioides sp. Root140 TaxID=1736460 RepID=UPI0006FD9840|nr:alpha/beta fold hydrolase [Nocardioides sp. Root140]KQY56432.1 hypothetical protein ASD30_08800 [Nocardioides sp. Root140]KRF13836.1 hypothetical protein ASG90_13505 [Nocardioides sp. Soil797]
MALHAPESDLQNAGDRPSTWESLLVESMRSQPVPSKELGRWLGALAHRPGWTATRLAGLCRQLVEVAAGASDVAPSRGDKRFSDPAWTGNQFYRRLVQSYLVLGDRVHQLLEESELDQRTLSRLRFVVDNVLDAVSPSNTPIHPAALKEFIDTGGANISRGIRHAAADVRTRPRVPAMVDKTKFEVGVNLASTPGTVVHRTPVFELIQYSPTTDRVRQTPLVLVPPTINKYYALDLAPARSVVEYLVSQNQQVFVVSWRNPYARHASWGADVYVKAVLDAIEVARQITRSEQAAVWGTCSGGIITAMALAHLYAKERGNEIAALVLPVTLLGKSENGTGLGDLFDEAMAQRAIRRSEKIGYLDGAALAEVFAWLRPNDLIWSYWVNNYLLGRKPPAFDLLYWNADTTRMPASLHRDFIDVAMGGGLEVPGTVIALDTPIDLGQITADTYVVGAITDHITPWTGCYRTTQLLGGKTEFVLSNRGHIAALVNPPGAAKASYQHSTDTPADPVEFHREATTHEGSWWPHFADWIGARTGELVPAPKDPGRGIHRPLCAAPGTYVFEK